MDANRTLDLLLLTKDFIPKWKSYPLGIITNS